MKSISVYVVDRNTMLEKRSVKELEKFIKKYEKDFDKKFLDGWKKSSPTIKKLTLCKMIVNVKGISKATKEWARKWIHENGFHEEIWI